MIKFKATVTGRDKLLKQFNALPKLTQDGLLESLATSILKIHSAAVKNVQATSSGGRETRHDPTREVTVSRPGDPPNTDTGRLISSIAFDVDPSDLKGSVGTNLKTGPWLEFGTTNMAARPWLRPAVKSTKSEIPKVFKTEVDKSLRKVASK